MKTRVVFFCFSFRATANYVYGYQRFFSYSKNMANLEEFRWEHFIKRKPLISEQCMSSMSCQQCLFDCSKSCVISSQRPELQYPSLLSRFFVFLGHASFTACNQISIQDISIQDEGISSMFLLFIKPDFLCTQFLMLILMAPSSEFQVMCHSIQH